jgi:hypothetical protein
MISAAVPKKHAMPMTMSQSGFSMAWESGAAAPAAGRLETRIGSNAAGSDPPAIAVACDKALILLMRGRHNRRRVAIKSRNSPSRVDFGLPVGYYSRNAGAAVG